ncbi:hypothetical protein GQR58_008110 [Nymphon striatum]|nr:hypothetical protein GQR58_008110 [Nymphon striatum]
MIIKMYHKMAQEFHLLHVALMLSLMTFNLRVDQNSLLDVTRARNPFLRQEISIGSTSDYDHNAGFHDSLHLPRFDDFMPIMKIPQERDTIFNELINLGVFSRHSNYNRDIYAYALNDENENTHFIQSAQHADDARERTSNHSEENIRNIHEIIATNSTETNSDSPELSEEDAELIEILWKQDIDLGISRDVYDVQNRSDAFKKNIEYENLKNTTEPDPEKPEDDDIFQVWKGLNYTIDTETGMYLRLRDVIYTNVLMLSNRAVVIGVAVDMVKAKDRSLLREYGGPLDLGQNWTNVILHNIGFVKREYILLPSEEPQSNEVPKNNENDPLEKIPVDETKKPEEEIMAYLNSVPVEDSLRPEERIEEAQLTDIFQQYLTEPTTANSNEISFIPTVEELHNIINEPSVNFDSVIDINPEMVSVYLNFIKFRLAQNQIRAANCSVFCGTVSDFTPGFAVPKYK